MGRTMLENLISIGAAAVSVGGSAASIYSALSSVATGRYQRQVLNLLQKQKVEPVRLSAHVLYLPQSSPISIPSSKTLDLRDVRELLDRVRATTGEDIISSAVLATPRQLRSALSNPWEVLFDVRPLAMHSAPTGADLVPILFWHDNIPYIGWQRTGMMKAATGFDFSPAVEAWAPKVLSHTKPEAPKDRRSKPEKASTPAEREGTVKLWSTARKFGFIKPNDGSTDVFVSLSDVQQAGLKALVPGQPMRFQTQSDPKGRGLMAINLKTKN